ncbi:MAG: hypothetical protein FJY26_04805 [Betaproteobacteria bacterium]|nr:hypothetical protein [Betaproteobacteria bacterium]
MGIVSSTVFTALFLLGSTLLTAFVGDAPLLRTLAVALAMLGAVQALKWSHREQTLQNAHQQLQRAIDSARQEIEAHYRQLAQDQSEAAVAQERRRIAADLHDDLGAPLLTIVHASGDERIAGLGRQALQEMRLSVRGLSGQSAVLAQAWADWRCEAMTRLSAAGIALDWPAPPEQHTERIGSRTMGHTTRILREVFNNLIGHSQATQCRVQLSIQGTGLVIDIEDNGVGFDTAGAGGTSKGLGLLNLQQRAHLLSGSCRVESRPGHGTRVRLEVALNV